MYDKIDVITHSTNKLSLETPKLKTMMSNSLKLMESHHNSLKLKESHSVWIICIQQACIEMQGQVRDCCVILLNEDPMRRQMRCHVSKTSVELTDSKETNLKTLKSFNTQLQKLMKNHQSIPY
jgi:hypothetical protein